MLLKRTSVFLLKTLDDYASSASVRLVKLTGKHMQYVHPKHLVKEKIWFERYLKKKDTLLDLGCGVGQTDVKIAKKLKTVVGMDVDKSSIEIAKKDLDRAKIENVRFTVGDANYKLPFKNQTFNKILVSDVLEHLEKRNYALAEIKRVLKKGGHLFLVMDNPETSWKRLKKESGLFYFADRDHKYEYPLKEILAILKRKNFKVIKTGTVTYDTPLKGFIDLTGAISLSFYKKLRKWRQNMVSKHPEETTGYRIVAIKLT